ncbi:LmeA family phospholipid-binding protein [Mycolicibacterium goodii]|uniref:LmeA family phospholipid-binding protein n=2 Tax=Mycolicibacterium goodii TaxID=134601 RepID=A0ABS6HWW0_MYCGD|nr:LmeA family phospholipid-binding protein [Mycolicibacterium goodii]MBU8827162.1 LmeA family phospholipid-binding protein [Mycolicibacterium goodii]MBU8840903.1 LmeA family phospholipid-binding protein [Mycolicibacterium goodii]
MAQMATPPQRPHQPRRQPGWQPGPHGRGYPPSDPATRRLPRPPRPEGPTEQLRAPRGEPPTEQFRARRAPTDPAATQKIATPRPPAAQGAPAGPPPKRAWLRSWQAAALIAVIAVALVIGGLAGAELYARHRAGALLVAVAECVVEDNATVSFGVNPPFLWQHITGHYTNISVQTAGRQVQAAEGMTADVTLKDIRLQGTADSKGTIGSLTATLSWTSAGIKDTVAENLPGVGSLVTGVSTDAAAGTITLEAAGDNRVTARPVVTDGDLALGVLDVTGPFSKETVQDALDGLTTKLNENYPLGIHADSVAVTDTGVVGEFSSQDASIPNDESDPCFARL